MKINCDSFILLLQENPGSRLPDNYQEHLEACRSCRDLLKAHDHNIEELKKRVAISETTKNNVLSKLQKEIAREKALSQDIGNQSFWARLNIFRLQVAFPLLVLVIVAGLFLVEDSGGSVQLTGPATVLKNSQKVVLEETGVKLDFGERISLLTGQLHLTWKNNEAVLIDGRLDFAVHKRNLTVGEGQATLDFMPSTAGYVVATRRATFTILGTTIVLDLSDSSDSIAVLKGKVAWALNDKSRAGEATAGTRIILKNGQVLEETFSTDAANMDGGVQIKKTGGVWTPKNSE